MPIALAPALHVRYNVRMLSKIIAVIIAFATGAAASGRQKLEIELVEGEVPARVIEIRGVAAGAFNPRHWQVETLHLLPDARRPLLAPREGQWRNIYAPSAVETDDGWRVFYGAWDGAPTGNDRIYDTTTTDFIDFGQRRTVIEHGPFHHVCNVNALRLADGSFSMVCTAYPDENGRNKPIFFRSPDGETWNGRKAPYTPTPDDLIHIGGYENFDDADINGMNVLLHEEGLYRLYFADFRNFGKIFRATGEDGRNYALDGVALEGRYAPNDIKKFRVGDESWYLMGLHMNTGRIFYSVSRDGLDFPEARELHSHRDADDRYMVAVGWVVRGDQEEGGRQLLGVLYGAGAVPSLDQNRIFATWLQKKAVFVTADGRRLEPTRAFGPDRQHLVTDDKEPLTGRIELYAEDGKTLIATTDAVTLEPGRAYRADIVR